jgi:hypothetical protein
MSKTIKSEKIPRRDEGAMALAYGNFKNANHGDRRKAESKDACRKFNHKNSSED